MINPSEIDIMRYTNTVVYLPQQEFIEQTRRIPNVLQCKKAFSMDEVIHFRLHLPGVVGKDVTQAFFAMGSWPRWVTSDREDGLIISLTFAGVPKDSYLQQPTGIEKAIDYAFRIAARHEQPQVFIPD